LAYIVGGIEYLPLQVGNAHYVSIRYANGAYACSGQVLQYWATQPSGTYNQHFCLLQQLLPCNTNLR
jgi:hypothetical protein